MAFEKKKKQWMVRIGNLVEESVAKGIYDLGQEAPDISSAPNGVPEEKVWYKVPIPEGRCGDGSEYHIYIRKGCSDKLCVFFSGGGIAINEYMAARPVNGGRVAAWLPNYYWNNLRLFTQVMNIGVGITRNGVDNPFDDWNFIVITYATGDMHVGNSKFTYHLPHKRRYRSKKQLSEDKKVLTEADEHLTEGQNSLTEADERPTDDQKSYPESYESLTESKKALPDADERLTEGKKKDREAVLYFHGYKNFLAAMRAGKKLFPTASKLLIAGESAGAFAVPALAEEIVGEFYPMCHDVTLFSDSAQLLYKGWKRTLRDVWKARRELWMGANSRNLTVDWYRGVCTRQGSKFKYLYAGSVRDYLLSAFYNDITNRIYGTDSEIQKVYYRQMKRMIADLRKLDPEFTFFIYDWHRPLSMYKGGTIHTAVRQPEFTLRAQDDVTMAYWLSECVEGRKFDVGMQLLE